LTYYHSIILLLLHKFFVCTFLFKFDCVHFQVFFGRPMLWGLVYGGEKGASEILELMRKEIDLTFALTGKLMRNFLCMSTCV